MTQSNPIAAAFGPLYGLPCWNVRPGHGSFLTLEFGTPHLEIIEPREARHTTSPRSRSHYARRKMVLHGEYHLWVYCCYWNFFLRGAFVGDSNSEKGIQRTVRELDGQKLVRVTANHLRGHCVFEFDLGGRLTTRPFDKPYDEPREQWMLFEPSGEVFTFRADGKYSYQPKDTRSEDEEWQPRTVPLGA